MEKISKEEISTYTDVKSRLEKWLKVFIKKMNERNLTPIRYCCLDEFEILYENLFLTYAYNQYDEYNQVTITIPLHVIYEDKMDWFINKLVEEKEQEKLEQEKEEKEKFELEKQEATETVKKLIEKYHISI